MTLKEKELIIINNFGIDNQLKKLMEEMYELIQAYTLYNIGEDTVEHLIEEFADVQVLLDQIKLKEELTDDEITNCKIDKVNRTLERIKNGYYK